MPIQARTSSTRLPGKVLKKLPYNSGITVLEQLVRRLKKSEMINEIILATTEEDRDLPLIEIAEKENIKWFRGSKDNVLSRYYKIALKNKLDIIVRVTSDNPCVVPEIIDTFIKKHLKDMSDYTADKVKNTFPYGVTAEIISFYALKEAHENSRGNFENKYQKDKSTYLILKKL